MTRDEAIEILKEIIDEGWLISDFEKCTAIDACEMAIEALEQEPTTKNDLGVDAVSRQFMRELGATCIAARNENGELIALGAIEELPSVTPQEQKTGHFIRWYEQKENDRYIENIPHCKCSECGKEYDSYSSQFIKYCSECGAKMVEPQESEDKE